jgi:hypothetical protein
MTVLLKIGRKRVKTADVGQQASGSAGAGKMLVGVKTSGNIGK